MLPIDSPMGNVLILTNGVSGRAGAKLKAHSEALQSNASKGEALLASSATKRFALEEKILSAERLDFLPEKGSASPGRSASASGDRKEKSQPEGSASFWEKRFRPPAGFNNKEALLAIDQAAEALPPS